MVAVLLAHVVPVISTPPEYVTDVSPPLGAKVFTVVVPTSSVEESTFPALSYVAVVVMPLGAVVVDGWTVETDSPMESNDCVVWYVEDVVHGNEAEHETMFVTSPSGATVAVSSPLGSRQLLVVDTLVGTTFPPETKVPGLGETE
jgi:hypothetical protein